MLIAAAVCPHPPLLVAPLAAGAAGELATVRSECAQAVALLESARPEVTFVVGADVGLRATSFAPWGVPVPIDVPEPLPLALLVGAHLTAGRLRSFVVVDPALDVAECVALGADLGAGASRVALLVMGDGSARHDVKAPGYLDPRADGFDSDVVRALATADVAALQALDPALADELLVAGRAPWQVLAGAAAALGRPDVALSSFTAPYGVGYHVAAWRWQESA